MITLFLFVSFGYSVMSNEKPFHVAAGFAVFVSLFSLMFGASIGDFLIQAVLYFIYASVFYYVLDTYGDAIFMALAILFVGALGLFFIPILLS